MGESNFPPFVHGVFRRRLNRFVALCEVAGRLERTHLPNPGRLRELLIPGRIVYLAERAVEEGATRYKLLAVERNAYPVVLDTLAANRVARWLIEQERVSGLEGYRIQRAEVAVGNSRFDFLLEQDGVPLYLEVKSCTLYQGKVAMFPDAITERGRRHLQELAELAATGLHCAVLFVVQAPEAECFLPDYHTDYQFSQTLLAVRDRVLVRAVQVRWDCQLRLQEAVRELPIPWALAEQEGQDSGAYLAVLHLSEPAEIAIGALGMVHFAAGYYVYVGSARRGITARLARHSRRRKGMHWHIDYLRSRAEWIEGYALRTQDDLECRLAAHLGELADWEIPGFGCSDCACGTHLFGFQTQPDRGEAFVNFLLDMRMARLAERL